MKIGNRAYLSRAAAMFSATLRGVLTTGRKGIVESVLDRGDSPVSGTYSIDADENQDAGVGNHDSGNTGASEPRVLTDGGVELSNDTESEHSVRSTLRMLTQPTRIKLVYDILGHPEGMPSVAELTYVNPSLSSRYSVLDHLDKLIDHGIVERVELTEGRRRDLPHTFFSVTPDGWKFLTKHELASIEDIPKFRETYSRVEKTEKVAKYEDATRPEVSWNVDYSQEDSDDFHEVLDEFAETGDVSRAIDEWENSDTDLSQSELKAQFVAEVRTLRNLNQSISTALTNLQVVNQSWMPQVPLMSKSESNDESDEEHCTSFP